MTRTTLLAVLCLSTLAACGDKEATTPEDDDDWGLEGGGGTGGGDDTGAACGSTYGFVSGTVTGPYTSDPNPHARVRAYDEDLGEVYDAEMAGDGDYELNVPGGVRYSLYAYEGDCFSSDVRVTIEECEEYEVDIEIIDCDVADMKNISGGRGAGSITAAQFLQRFIKEGTPWAHLDIAGVAWSTKDKPTVPKGGTGYGVRLLDAFVAEHYEK